MPSERSRLGARGEAMAAANLQGLGYRIVERQYKTPVGEIDIIARRGAALAFVEVKARTDLETAAASIGARQQARIERAALAYIVRHPDCAELDVRFDVILIARGRWPKHMPGAWRPRE